jgi:hypothetical protein
MKYVYCIPTGGFNDQLAVLNSALEYCNKYNRILLIHKEKLYDINYESLLSCNNIIHEPDKIKNIICGDNITIHPSVFNNRMIDIFNNKIHFTFSRPAHSYKNIILSLPLHDLSENIILYVNGGGNGYPLFKKLYFQLKIKQIISDRYETLKKPYLSIQIRNTDYKCDYELLYENNIDEIHSAIEIYIATDDKKALRFFIDKGLPVKNFTTFPVASEYRSLHSSQLDPHIKFIDMLSDIYICGMSDKLITSSKGGFIRLIRNCNQNKDHLNKQFEIIDE